MSISTAYCSFIPLRSDQFFFSPYCTCGHAFPGFFSGLSLKRALFLNPKWLLASLQACLLRAQQRECFWVGSGGCSIHPLGWFTLGNHPLQSRLLEPTCLLNPYDWSAQYHRGAPWVKEEGSSIFCLLPFFNLKSFPTHTHFILSVFPPYPVTPTFVPSFPLLLPFASLVSVKSVHCCRE